MCQGRRFPDSWQPPPSALGSAMAQLAEWNAELAAARARLAESMALLERERARAAALRRRLDESYAEKERLKKMASAMVIVRDWFIEKRQNLQEDSRSQPA